MLPMVDYGCGCVVRVCVSWCIRVGAYELVQEHVLDQACINSVLLYVCIMYTSLRIYVPTYIPTYMHTIQLP